MYDLVIRNGNVVDGSGSEPYLADIAISGGAIQQVGKVTATGAEEIDAAGLIVTPGFIDVHTHYDGQVTWESHLAPSSNHGVTTIVTGNCGVGFAPCRPQDHEDLIDLMAGVEDIPEVVMAEGLEWNWETFPEYLDAVQARPHDVDIAAMIPHSALRVYVMGERAVRREHANQHDIAHMAELASEAMDAGAIGFGTSRAIQQKSIKGEPIPTVGASEDELQAIVAAVSAKGGVFQVLSDFEQFRDVEGEFAMLERVVRNSGTKMSYTLHQKHPDPEGWRELLRLTEQANDNGVRIKGQILARPTGLLLGHEITMSPFSGCPTYRELKKLPFEEMMDKLRDPEIRAKILDEYPRHGARSLGNMFELEDVPNYEPDPGQNISALAERAGKAPAEFAYDLLLEDGGKRLLFDPAQNFAYGSLEPTFEMMSHRDTILGLGDGGAHCGLVCDASFPTTVLSYWARDRVRGARLTLPQAVKKLAADTADAVGLHDRGRIAPGYKADLNVIDHARLKLHKPRPVYDLPTGGRRIIQEADGYVATILSGVVTYRDGQRTGELPGNVVRGRQAAPKSLESHVA